MAESSQSTQLVLKSINQLLDNSFFIPAYQRGYRWTELQIMQLLNDIWEFAEDPPKHEHGEEKPFYCLQPIVVTKYTEKEKKQHNLANEDDWYEVIDGQQRLTTIFLIIHYFNEMWVGKQKITEPILQYETRKESSEFLSKIEIDDSKVEININETDKKEILKEIGKVKINRIDEDNNVDFFHIAQAYKAIQYWVLKQEKFDNNKFQSIFLNDTKVIWYEISEGVKNNHFDIFTRLNIGKIPLTNAELIKALFLQKDNFVDGKATLKQIQIATEWDIIEKTLQDDAFWYFIYNPTNPMKYDNRIEYIFDLMKNRTLESEFYYTYNKFYEDFPKSKKNNETVIDEMWLSIKQYFLSFEEWFKDYRLFHYVGYLIDCVEGKNNEEYSKNIITRINDFKNKAKQKDKTDFKKYLKEEIKKQVNCNINELEYGNKQIRKVLLLFNIQTILETQKSEMRFPFHRYKSEDWDIEHVRSKNDQNDTGNIKNHDEWANDILDFFVGSTDAEKINEFVENQTSQEIKEICESILKYQNETEKNQKQEGFSFAYQKVSAYFKESNTPDNIDSVSNLALLDATTNRSYGNAFFPIKRKRIIENDKNGIFVPICTKNLFLKYYSKKLGEVMYWNNDDANDYQQAIKDTLEEFLDSKKIPTKY